MTSFVFATGQETGFRRAVPGGDGNSGRDAVDALDRRSGYGLKGESSGVGIGLDRVPIPGAPIKVGMSYHARPAAAPRTSTKKGRVGH